MAKVLKVFSLVAVVIAVFSVLEINRLEGNGTKLVSKTSVDSRTLQDICLNDDKESRIVAVRRHGAGGALEFEVTISDSIVRVEGLRPNRMDVSADRIAMLSDGQVHLGRVVEKEFLTDIGVICKDLLDIKFCSDGKLLVGVRDGGVVLWDACTLDDLAIDWADNTGRFLCFGPKGGQLVESTEDQLRIRNVENGEVIAAIETGFPSSGACISPDLSKVLICRDDLSEVQLWSLGSGAMIWKHKSNSSRSDHLALSDHIAFFLGTGPRDVICGQADADVFELQTKSHPVHSLRRIGNQVTTWDMCDYSAR